MDWPCSDRSVRAHRLDLARAIPEPFEHRAGVLSDRGHVAHRRLVPAQIHGRKQRRDFAGAGADGPPALSARELRVRPHVLDAVEATGGDAGALEQRHHLLRRHPGEALFDHRGERFTVVNAIHVRAETGILRQLWLPQYLGAQLLPLAFVLQAEDDLPSISGAVGTVWSNGGMRRPAARLRFAPVVTEV